MYTQSVWLPLQPPKPSLTTPPLIQPFLCLHTHTQSLGQVAGLGNVSLWLFIIPFYDIGTLHDLMIPHTASKSNTPMSYLFPIARKTKTKTSHFQH
jgi:hypothetical protein